MVVSGSVLLGRIRRGLRKVESDPLQWLILMGDRLVVAGVLSALFGLGFAVLQYARIVVVTDTTQMLYLFQGLATGNLTLVTIVVSINQLVLSREFNTPGELHDQVENVIDYRERVQEAANRATVPSTPADFLSVLLDATRTNAQRVGGVIEGTDDERLLAEARALISEVTSRTEHISDVLDSSQEGLFSALAVTLETNYSHQLSEAYRLQTAFEDDLSAPAHESLAELIESLQLIDIARQYFKSIYMQSELARLSRIVLYVGVPAIGGALLLLSIYASSSEPPANAAFLRLAVPLVVVLGFTPLAILFSFIIRISMIAQHTVAITPFTTPTQEKADTRRGTSGARNPSGRDSEDGAATIAARLDAVENRPDGEG